MKEHDDTGESDEDIDPPLVKKNKMLQKKLKAMKKHDEIKESDEDGNISLLKQNQMLHHKLQTFEKTSMKRKNDFDNIDNINKPQHKPNKLLSGALKFAKGAAVMSMFEGIVEALE